MIQISPDVRFFNYHFSMLSFPFDLFSAFQAEVAASLVVEAFS